MNQPSPHIPGRRFGRRALASFSLLAILGLLPILPVMIKGSPILNNDMLVAYFCYFWDFHRNWSWSHPLVFWSSSYQCGMPMHAYWQSGYLYPVTWLFFGPLPPHFGIYLFYAFHFSLGIFGFLKLGPRLGLHRTASWWAGICFSLSGTMLARYEHATFLSGWAWIPLVLAAFLSLRDTPGPRTFFLYAAAVALQALGGHPQASLTTAILIGAFTCAFAATTVTPLLLRRLRSHPKAGAQAPRAPSAPSGTRLAWILGGHLLALVYCAPMLIPFVQMVGQTDRFDGVAWEGGKPGENATADQATQAALAGAAEKLEAGVFGFDKFATGGMRPIHLLSLAAPHALGSPSNASWWGGEVWGEVFVYLGGLGLFFCFFASPKRARSDLRWLWILGAVGLWLSFGAHLGASQVLYHLPVLNNFRRPARFLILFAFAMAALSGHGLQRWLGHPRGGGLVGRFAIAALVLGGGFASLRFLPEILHTLLAALQKLKHLDTSKDYSVKLSALLGRGAIDCVFLSLSAATLWWQWKRWQWKRWQSKTSQSKRLEAPKAKPEGIAAPTRERAPRYGLLMIFVVLLADLLRIHWDHFYLFPSDYYRKPPVTVQALDQATSPYWRVSHYLEYPGLEMWEMHNDPIKHFGLLEREKDALSCGIHAIFGYRHVTAHLPLLWQWDASLTPAEKSTRYLFSNRDLGSYRHDTLNLLGSYAALNAYELVDWRPRLETASHKRAESALRFASRESWNPEIRSARNRTECQSGYSGYGGICVSETRDGEFRVSGRFAKGDTLIIRERFSPEWRYRIDAGIWKSPVETPDRFAALPVDEAAVKIEMVYVPKLFYQMVGFALVVTTGLAGLFRFRKPLRKQFQKRP